MLGVPTSKPAVFVLLVSSAAWTFCLSPAAFPEMAGVGEPDGEILVVGVKLWLISPLCPLRRSEVNLSNATTQHIAISP